MAQTSIASTSRVHATSARSLLLYTLGDVVYPSQDAFPSSALHTVLGGSGVEEAAARQAISRSSRAGWLEGRREGRQSWWVITPRTRALIDDGLRRIAMLGDEPQLWDGRWVIVVTSIPHGRRVVRQRLYRYLTWSGFGTPVTSVWVSPFANREASARFAIDRFDLRDRTVSFVGEAGSVGLADDEIVANAWSLGDLDMRYRNLVDRFAAHQPIDGPSGMRSVLELDGELQILPQLDPQLPTELVANSATRSAAQQLLAFRADWLRGAREYWGDLVDQAKRAHT